MIKLTNILQENIENSLYVSNSPIHGKGLFTKTNIPAGTPILTALDFEAYKAGDENNNLSKYVNHSSNKENIKVIESGHKMILVATKDIKPNEELTTNYKKLPVIFDRDTTGFVNEITINSPQPIKDKIKDLIIKLVQNVDQFNMREIANVLGKYGYEDLIFDDAELYNPDFTGIKDLRSLYNDLQKVQSKLNINESIFYDDVTEKVIKGFKLIPFKQGFSRSFKSTSQKASPQLAERINKWIKNKFPESKTMVKYEKNYQTINFLYPAK